MIPKQLQEQIMEEAKDEKYNWNPAEQYSYVTGATKYADKMYDFSEWCAKHYFRNRKKDIWYLHNDSTDKTFTTSDLLTIFIKTIKP